MECSYTRNTFIRILFLISASCLTTQQIMSSYLRKTEEAKSIFADFSPIETDRLILRSITPEDAQDLFEMLSTPSVIDNTAALEVHTSREQTKDLIDQILNSYTKNTHHDWSLIAIADKSSNKLIGFCGFFGYSPVFSRAEIGYALSPNYWGQGLVSEAALALVDFGFIHMGLNRIEATVYPENGASGRILEKIGMQREGLLRQHVMRNGVFRDRLVYAILRDEWQKNKTDQ